MAKQQVITSEDYIKNCIRVRPFLVRHLSRNHLIHVVGRPFLVRHLSRNHLIHVVG